MTDLLIRGAEVVDGTGVPARRADIAVTGGRITGVGKVAGADAASVIDANGLVASPGFVDLHTHYDAQLFWDSALTPSCLHGVTSLVSGNCGFTLAPLPAQQDQYLVRLLSRVEGIPLKALEEGVPWNWRTSAEYFAAVDGTTSLNIGFLVGHSALRRFVMGQEATERAARPGEIRQLEELLRAGLRAGGLGLSSTRSQTHFDGEGEPVPSRHADPDEFVALARVCGEFAGTSIETSPVASTGVLGPDDVNLMIDMSLAARRPVNWNAMTVSAAELDICRANLDAGALAASRGARVVAMTIPMPVQVRYSFYTGVFLDALPGWDEFMRRPPQERLSALADPGERARLNALAQQPGPRREQANWGALTVLEGFTPFSRSFEGQTIGAIAARDGREPFDVLSEIVVADRLLTGVGRIPRDPSEADWAAKHEVWTSGRAVVGASDAGAHLDVLGIFNYPTWLLQEAVRKHRVLSLEQAVALLTSVPAELYGFHDRGTLAPGYWADIVLFDPHAVGTTAQFTRNDLPGGSARIFADALGIERVIVAGRTIALQGKPTSERPGVVLRRGRDTRTPSLAIPRR